MKLLLLVLLVAASEARADKPGSSAKELVDWVDAKLAAIGSLEIELETTIPSPPRDQVVSTMIRTDVLQIVRDGDKQRIDSRGVTTYACQQPGCKRPKPEPPAMLVLIRNGNDRFQFVPGGKTAHRSVRPKQTDDRANPLRLARWLRDVRTLRADTDGAYVINGSEPNGITTTIYISPTTGLPTKLVTRMGGVEMTTVTKRVEVGKTFAQDRFALPTGMQLD